MNIAADHVQEGERIITQHETITQLDKRRLDAYEAALVQLGIASRGTGFIACCLATATQDLGEMAQAVLSDAIDQFMDDPRFQALLRARTQT